MRDGEKQPAVLDNLKRFFRGRERDRPTAGPHIMPAPPADATNTVS